MNSMKDLDLVSIPAVEFEMGSSIQEVENCVSYWKTRLIRPEYIDSFRDWILKEYPKHRVRLDSFLIARFPVTNLDYQAFLAATSRAAPESIRERNSADHPVWGVSLDDATAYAEWIGNRIGRACRLPTEAEWECVARGLSNNEYPYGREFDPTKCNTVESRIGATTPVHCYSDGASEYGVFDLAGNVEEWTSSFYAPYPGGRFVVDDLSRGVSHKYPILRGGSFALGGDLARCARRHGPHPDPVFRFRGFRLVIASGY